jgi:hypothetical protein
MKQPNHGVIGSIQQLLIFKQCWPLQIDTTWEQVACGKTPDQQFVTEQAKTFIANYRTAARTLQFNAPTVA